MGGGVTGGVQMYCSERTLKTYPALRKVEDCVENAIPHSVMLGQATFA